MTAGHVLVTGATGLIGEAVCHLMLRDGKSVIATWSRTRPFFSHPRLNWVHCDLTESCRLKQLGKVEAILHLAAAIPSGKTTLEAAAKINQAIDSNILSLVAKLKVRFVYASGTAVYETTSSAIADYLTESAPIRPSNVYLEEKIWAEQRGMATMKEMGLPFTSLRICAPYGPRQRHRTVMRIFIERALTGEPLYYFGTGSREQSFTHARDIARAFLLSLDCPGGVFNIAAPTPISMKELAVMIVKQAGLDESMVVSAGKPDAQEGFKARYSIDAAAKVLGWRPNVPLSEGVAEWLAAERNRRINCE